MQIVLREDGRKEFKTFLENISKLNAKKSSKKENFTINFDRDGLKVSETDRAMVSCMKAEFKSVNFDEYDCKTSEKITINLDLLLKIFKRTKKEDKIKLEIKDKNLEIKIYNNWIKIFTIPILEEEPEEKPDIDKMKFESKAELDAKEMQRIVSDAYELSDNIMIATQNKEIRFLAESGIQKLDVSHVNDFKNPVVKSYYSLDYLSEILKVKGFEKVNIEFSKDYPIRISFKKDWSKIEFIVAPRA